MIIDRIAWVLTLTVALGGAPAAAEQPTAPVQPGLETIIATIDGQPATVGAFMAYYGDFVRSARYHAAAPDEMRALAEQAAEKFVIDGLLAHEAERRHLPANAAEVESRIEKIRKRYGDTVNWPAIEADLPRIRGVFEKESRLAALYQQVTNMADPGEAAMRGFYEEHRAELFIKPETLNLNMILLRVPSSAPVEKWREAEAKAAELRQQLVGGADFAALALDNSYHRSAARGGALGDVHAGQMPAQVEEALRPLAPGEITPPTRMLEGVAIFRLNTRQPPQAQPFDDVRARARVLLKTRRQEERWSAFVAELRPRATIDQAVLEAALDSAFAAPAPGKQ